MLIIVRVKPITAAMTAAMRYANDACMGTRGIKFNINRNIYILFAHAQTVLREEEEGKDKQKSLTICGACRVQQGSHRYSSPSRDA